MDEAARRWLSHLYEELVWLDTSLSKGWQPSPSEAAEGKIFKILSQLKQMTDTYDELRHLTFYVDRAADDFDEIDTLLDGLEPFYEG